MACQTVKCYVNVCVCVYVFVYVCVSFCRHNFDQLNLMAHAILKQKRWPEILTNQWPIDDARVAFQVAQTINDFRDDYESPVC